MTDHQMALEELKILQGVIARQDEFRAKTKSVAIAALSALFVAFHTESIEFGYIEFFFVSFFCLLLS